VVVERSLCNDLGRVLVIARSNLFVLVPGSPFPSLPDRMTLQGEGCGIARCSMKAIFSQTPWVTCLGALLLMPGFPECSLAGIPAQVGKRGAGGTRQYTNSFQQVYRLAGPRLARTRGG
jgi:hypothetical protein